MSDTETIVTPSSNRRDPVTGRLLPGNTCGIRGRPRGSRNRLGEEFITNPQADWTAHGPEVIATVRRDDPSTYMTIVARLLPQEVAIGTPGDFGSCRSAEEVLDRLLGDFDDPREALASFDAMRALLIERIAAQARPIQAASVEPVDMRLAPRPGR
jgi:hypothetical protein